MKLKSYLALALLLVLASDVLSENVGNTLFVDADPLIGNDSTGTRGRSDLPFHTLGAAKTAASSGDTISVRPGSYPGTNLLKNGVNWYFYPGAIVTQTSGSGILDDTSTGTNAPVTTLIGGSGTFISNNYVLKTNAASDITLNAEFIGGEGAAGTFIIRHYGNAKVSINANKIYSASMGAVWWQYKSGDMFVHANLIQGAQAAVYSNYGLGSVGDVDGQFYVWAKLIKETSSATAPAFGAVSLSSNNDLAAKVWVYASQLESVHNYSVTVNSNKLYVTAQKCFGPVLVNNFGGNGAAQLWLNTQKISPRTGESSVDITLNGGLSYIYAGLLEDSATSTADLIQVNGGTHYVSGLAATRVSNGNGVSVSGGSLNVIGLSIKTLPSYLDLAQTGGVLTVLGCSYDTAKISGIITQGEARVARAAQFGTGPSLPADGSTYTFFLTTGLMTHFWGWDGTVWKKLDN